MAQQPEIKITESDGWLHDERGNRNRISYWGSREVAETALRSLKNCDYCINCSDCSGCSGCSDCSRCSGCSRCSDCSGCSRCSDCSGCSDCSRCSRCSDCSGCSRCSDCSRCSGLYFKIGANATEAGEANNGPPPVPTIPDIHAAIYAAVSKPGALDMEDWHTCDNTHCRAGWTVHLAGPEGYALEKWYGGKGGGSTLAAMMIYDASDPAFRINPGRFFDGNETALADMKRLAEAEAA